VNECFRADDFSRALDSRDHASLSATLSGARVIDEADERIETAVQNVQMLNRYNFGSHIR
jgi:hypothetical protein